MNRELRLFLDELVAETKRDCVSIILFGSAANKNWKRGESDIDIIFVAKRDRRELKQKLRRLILRLDRKYGLNIGLVCFGLGKNPLERAFLMLENYFFYRMPYYVFSEDWIGPKKLKIIGWRVKFLSCLGSLKIFMMNLKKTGKTLYGKDLISDLEISPISRFEKFRQLFWLFLLSVATLFINPKAGRHELRKVLKYNYQWIY